MRSNPFGKLDPDTAVSLARPFDLAVNKVARDGSQDNGVAAYEAVLRHSGTSSKSQATAVISQCLVGRQILEDLASVGQGHRGGVRRGWQGGHQWAALAP